MMACLDMLRQGAALRRAPARSRVRPAPRASILRSKQQPRRPRVVTRLRGRAEVVLPLADPVARLAGQVELRVLLELLHRLLLGVHDRPRLVGAEGRLVAARLAREAAVGVAHRALVVALERVEVVVVAGLLRVPRVEDGGLGINAPDVVEGRDVGHHGRGRRAHLHRRGDARDKALGGGEKRQHGCGGRVVVGS